MEPDRTQLLAWLAAHVVAGADEALLAQPINCFASVTQTEKQPAAPLLPEPPQRSKAPRRAAPVLPRADPPVLDEGANAVAKSAPDLAALERALEEYEGCSLKKTATNTVFGDGNPQAGLMVIGEAPGAEEDRLGRPFVGAAGQLLDRMLAAIGFTNRETYYITNVCYWRPPGNRKPSDAELAACRPFTLRQIALIRPRLILLLGGVSAQNMLGRTEGITRLRGKWAEIAVDDIVVPALPSFHPAYLLRQPLAKREAWRDLQALAEKWREITPA
ncbi:MAG TPA: uracil-DNA glycosylase [Dongiaceae bacterium]|jgi:DNA polymerase|nr:uracil-DNA glycosylase [Dongiaceae bacterium]